MKPDKIYLSLAFLLIFTTISWISSCTHEDNISYPEICFRDVRNIFNSSCAYPIYPNGEKCHDGTGEPESLITYDNIYSSVIPGNPYASKSYKAIIATWGENKMPPSGPLSLEKRTIIRLWIEQGARDTTFCPDINTTGSDSRNGFLNN